MSKYAVSYMEVYRNTYVVEANNPEEAKKKLLDAIMNGEECGPDECIDSGVEEINEIVEEEIDSTEVEE